MEENNQRPKKKRVTRRQLRRRRIGGLIVLLLIIFLLSKGCASCISCTCNLGEDDTDEKSTTTTVSTTDITTAPPIPESTLPKEQLVEVLPESHKIEVPVIYQEPELPTGSAATSLTMLLNYLGFNIDKVTIANDYMPRAKRGEATFSQAFIGDPTTNDGLGCFAPVIVETAQKYLRSQSSSRIVKTLNADSFDDVLLRVASDYPVLVWINSNLDLRQEEYCFTLYGPGGVQTTTQPPVTSVVVLGTTAAETVQSDIETTTTTITTSEQKQDVYWIPNATCVLLTGYDKINNTITVIDPMQGEMIYDMGMFKTSYNALYKQAVIIY